MVAYWTEFLYYLCKQKQTKESKTMAREKKYRGNKTRLLEGRAGDNPKLMAQALSDGRESLYLEYYFGYSMVESKNGNTYKKVNRESERLNLFLWQAPRDIEERQQNKETLEVAKRVRFERAQQLLEDTEGYRLKKNRDINFLEWMWSYYEAYTKADIRQIKRAYVVFVDFLTDAKGELLPRPEWTDTQREKATAERERRASGLRLKPQQLTKEMVVAFSEYLKSRFKGEGAHTLYARFKKIVKAAVEADVMRKNPTTGVSIKIDRGTLKKDVLSEDELKMLLKTHYRGENENIRRAFIFCLYTGLRFCDVKALTYANIDYSNMKLRFEQAKTEGHSAASSVVIDLREDVLPLIGGGKRDELIFKLPSHTMCNKALRHWVKQAGIDKHITWHCARHSFAVNILNNGANIKTIASLLGHSGLQHTEKYTRAVDSLKKQAINTLPKLEL